MKSNDSNNVLSEKHWTRYILRNALYSETRTSPHQLPSALPATHLGYILVRQSIQQGCLRAGEHSKRACVVVVPETPTLARPCSAHGGWTPSKECPLWWTCVRFQTGWPSNAMLQGRVQEGHEVCRDQSRLMGSSCSWSQWLASCHPDRCQESWGQEGAGVARQKEMTKGKSILHTLATNSLHMQKLWPRLPLENWTLQSQSTLPQYSELTFCSSSSFETGGETNTGI